MANILDNFKRGSLLNSFFFTIFCKKFAFFLIKFLVINYFIVNLYNKQVNNVL